MQVLLMYMSCRNSNGPGNKATCQVVMQSPLVIMITKIA